MIVYEREDMASSRTGCYPSLSSLYSVIPRDVRLHMERVGIYGEAFCKFLEHNGKEWIQGFEQSFLEKARALFILHDIGRIFVPIRFQNKAGGLTDEEYAQIKSHAMLTPEALDSIYELEISDELKIRLSNIALYHHERWDGKGYPFGLKETEIPVEAAICSLVDAYDGMTSWKSYRTPMDKEKVKKIVLEEAGKQFHPELAGLFAECIDVLPENLGAAWEAQAGKYF